MAAGSSSQMLGWLAVSAGTVILYAAYKGRSPLSVVQNNLNPSVPVRDLPGLAAVPELLPLPAGRSLPSYGPLSSGYVPAVQPTGSGGSSTPGSIRGLQPHVVAARQELASKFSFTSIGGFATSGHITNSDHYKGLALDLMTKSRATLHATGDYLIQHAGRLRVTYIIRDRQIWSRARSSEGWRPYSGTSPHTDHVHVSFEGAVRGVDY